MKLQKYDIILCKPKSLWNKIVCKLLNQEYCHATIFIGNYHCVESNITGVKVKEFNNRLGEFDAYRLIKPISERQKLELETFIQKQINKPYNFILAIGSIFNMKYDKNSQYVCYSFIDKALSEIGIEINSDLKAFDKFTMSANLNKVE